jgi:hypothetical protein
MAKRVKPKAQRPRTIDSGLAIWRDLKKRGGLDLRRPRGRGMAGYDVPFEGQLNDILFPTKKASLEANLRSTPVPPEEFFAAFFAALQPFSMIVSDVLKFFKTADAKYGDRNLKVVFNFSKGAELKLDLEHFRDLQQYLRRVIRPIGRWAWSSAELFNINQQFHNGLKNPRRQQVRDGAVRDWDKKHGLPHWLDPPPIQRSGVPRMDALLDRCDRLLRDYVNACRSLAPDRPRFVQAFQDAQITLNERGDVASPEAIAEAERIVSIFLPESDYWEHQFAQAATLASEFILSQPQQDRSLAAEKFIDPVNKAIDVIDRGGTVLQTWEKDYRDILNLPIWRRRHELYAVWVGSQIASAIGEFECVFHVEDGVLRFPFSGAQLATVRSHDKETYMFWTELRSRLPARSATGRKAIQPDYRILRMPFDPVRGTVLVVECKQYRRSSMRNFSAALNDYATGCPNARVLLVNNGPIAASVMSAVKNRLKPRAMVVQNFRPDQPESLTAFRAVVWRSVSPKEDIQQQQPGVDAADRPVLAAVVWAPETGFRGLDLHIVIRDRKSGASILVNYANPGEPSAAPWVWLPEDVRSSPGLELAYIAKWLDATYEIYVHNYDEDVCPKSHGVIVFVQSGNEGKLSMFSSLENPKPGERCWFVCRVDGTSRKLERVDQFLAAPPL